MISCTCQVHSGSKVVSKLRIAKAIDSAANGSPDLVKILPYNRIILDLFHPTRTKILVGLVRLLEGFLRLSDVEIHELLCLCLR